MFIAQMEGKTPVSVWESLVSTMGALLYEPHFGNEIVEEQITYLLEGMDIDPYIDDVKWAQRSEELGKDLPRPLPRFLSYEIDSGIQQRIIMNQQQLGAIDLLSISKHQM